MNSRYWRPVGDAEPNRWTSREIPDIGQVIAVIPTRQPWRVLEVTEVHQANWSDPTWKAWRTAGEPAWETWPGRERALLVEPPRNPSLTGKDRIGIRLSPWWPYEQWRPLKDQFPVCLDCARCWPCPCDDANQTTVESMAELDRLAAIRPGCCWGCGQPITSRQRSVVFDGENLLLPGAGPAAFHTSWSRKANHGYATSCREDAEAYEQRWVAAGEDRTVRLRCPGLRFNHPGYMDCTNVECPGTTARHQDSVPCTTQVMPPSGEPFHGGSWIHYPRPAIHPDEVRAPSNCGTRGCRGVAADEAASTEARQA